jgi:hypothetical protein
VNIGRRQRRIHVVPAAEPEPVPEPAPAGQVREAPVVAGRDVPAAEVAAHREEADRVARAAADLA